MSKTPGSMGGPVGGAASSLLATGAAYGGVVECHLPPQANSLLIKLTAALDAGHPRRKSHDPGQVEAVQLIAAGACEEHLDR
jgi:hypothetical protein